VVFGYSYNSLVGSREFYSDCGMIKAILRRSRCLYGRPSPSSMTSKRGVVVSKSILASVEQSANTDSLWPKLREAVSLDPRRLIVLDDDPTGCQTVYDINVLLDYSVESIEEQLKLDDKLFYILTNTRSLNQADAIRVTKLVIGNIQKAVKNTRYPHLIQYISRSDSTLRGHHPAEVQAIGEALAVPFDSTIVMPGKNLKLTPHLCLLVR
jgi:Sugar-binding N-terminal domain